MCSADEVPSRGAPWSCDIAIVGMACVMPGAPDVEAFWSNIVDGVDSVTEVSPTRWNPNIYFDDDYDSSKRRPGEHAKSVSKWGGFVPDVGFDALAWGIPPASLASIDPAQLLALKVAASALDDAAYGQGDEHRSFDRDRASVVYATGSGDAPEIQAALLLRLLLRGHHVDDLPADLDAFLPELTEDALPGALTSVIAGRVANRLDLGGKNLTVDSACASVLVALDIACNELASGSSDLVLCGGVDLHNSANDYVKFTAAHALARSGRCRSFDADADGMTLAEGAGCVVLKRLADAERDGDRIYAVVKGVAGSSDGRHLGLTAPREEGQVKAMQRAYQATGLSPSQIGLVEAHGTGTAAGDRVELRTTTQVFVEAGATPGSVVIGSVKSNIGHIKCAAGIASLIKAAKAAYHGVLPPTLHVRRPSEVWEPATSPFVFRDRARPWLGDHRLVAVSGFGFGGTNFHAIVENHQADPALPPGRPERRSPRPAVDPPTGRPQWPSELFAFRAATDADLDDRLDELSTRLARELGVPRQADRWRLRDVAASVSASGTGPVRLAIVAGDLDDLATKLDAARAGRAGRAGQAVGGVYTASAAGGSGAGAPAVAFLFPGPQAARPHMAADLLVAFPARRDAARAGRQWVDAMLPPQAFGDEVDRQRAALAGVARPAVALASLTVARTLAALGVAPTRVAGLGSPLLSTPERADRLRESLRALSGRSGVSEPSGRGELGDIALQVAALREADSTGPADPEARFLDAVRKLAADGISVFVEVGPGQQLAALVGRALADVPHLAVSADRPGEHGITSLLHALAQLAVAGVPLDFEMLHAGRDPQRSHWDEPGPRPAWIVNGQCARAASGDPLPNGLRPATDAPVLQLATGPAAPHLTSGANDAGAAGGLSAGEIAMVVEYLRIIQGMISTGSEIIRGHVSADQG
jgi:acyl transferase domain-containing protein